MAACKMRNEAPFSGMPLAAFRTVAGGLIFAAVSYSSAYGQILGNPPAAFVAESKSWASEEDGIFYASCHVLGENEDAYLVMPRHQKDAALVLVMSRQAVSNIGTMKIRRGVVETRKVVQGGVWIEEYVRRAAVAALKERLVLTFSLKSIFDRPPTRDCRLPPEHDWSKSKK